jgi:hypothetical protein
VTPDYKPTVVSYLKLKINDPRFQFDAEKALIGLNDDETIISVVDRLNKGTLEDIFLLSSNINAQGIKHLIPVIYEGSDLRKDVGYGRIQSPRRQAIALFLGPLAGVNGFSLSTSRWSSGFLNQMQNTGDDPHIFWIFQQWWEHNKGAVLAGKYSEATWLPLYKGKVDDFSSAFRNEPEYRTYTKEFRNDILPIPKKATAALPRQVPPDATTVVSRKKNGAIWLAVGIGGIALLVAGWAWVKKMKPA